MTALGWQAWLAIAAGGTVGGALRYAVSGWVARRVGESFPWGTMAVNASGAFAIGLVAAWWPGAASPWWPPLVVGLLGSYTTVSSFSLQTLHLLHDGETARAAGNVVATLVVCLGGALAGLALGTAS